MEEVALRADRLGADVPEKDKGEEAGSSSISYQAKQATVTSNQSEPSRPGPKALGARAH